jgi:hypothetical protein
MSNKRKAVEINTNNNTESIIPDDDGAVAESRRMNIGRQGRISRDEERRVEQEGANAFANNNDPYVFIERDVDGNVISPDIPLIFNTQDNARNGGPFIHGFDVNGDPNIPDTPHTPHTPHRRKKRRTRGTHGGYNKTKHRKNNKRKSRKSRKSIMN